MDNEDKILTMLEQLQKGQAALQADVSNIKADIGEIKEKLKDIDESIGAFGDWADSTATVTKISFAGGSASIS